MTEGFVPLFRKSLGGSTSALVGRQPGFVVHDLSPDHIGASWSKFEATDSSLPAPASMIE
jgi:hypothetical protein